MGDLMIDSFFQTPVRWQDGWGRKRKGVIQIYTQSMFDTVTLAIFCFHFDPLSRCQNLSVRCWFTLVASPVRAYTTRWTIIKQHRVMLLWRTLQDWCCWFRLFSVKANMYGWRGIFPLAAAGRLAKVIPILSVSPDVDKNNIKDKKVTWHSNRHSCMLMPYT